jgi:beta-phosphoglucomutase-like phosphatase (HAD superfamily)
MPELVIFDCDGVLVDSEAISAAVLARMVTREGLPTTSEQARCDYQGLLLADVFARVQERLGRALPGAWLADYERERAVVFERDLRAVRGAAELVGAVRAAGAQVCVASQGKLSKMRLTLGLTGLDVLFPEGTLFSAEDVARPKPYPDLFEHAAATLGVQPAACVVIEDSPLGVTAAVAAGMRVFGYAADSDREALAAAGAELVHCLAELPALLGLVRV